MKDTEKKTLGVIGGMGPAATAYFMDLVVRMTKAETDQEHLNIMVCHVPTIPDRTGYILDHRKPSPLPAIIDYGRKLAALGANYAAIPCITAHYFYKSLDEELPIPIINGVEETVSYLKAMGYTRVGVMATSGTLHACVFQSELERQGLEAVLPLAQRQKDVMDLIYKDIKSGRPGNMERFNRVTEELRSCGAEVIILGCTELSIIKRDSDIGAGFIDVLEVLARASIEHCGGEVREEYENLISQ